MTTIRTVLVFVLAVTLAGGAFSPVASASHSPDNCQAEGLSLVSSPECDVDVGCSVRPCEWWVSIDVEATGSAYGEITFPGGSEITCGPSPLGCSESGPYTNADYSTGDGRCTTWDTETTLLLRGLNQGLGQLKITCDVYPLH